MVEPQGSSGITIIYIMRNADVYRGGIKREKNKANWRKGLTQTWDRHL